MVKSEITWDYREGRDREGDKYAVHVLIHASGRILAKVHAADYFFRAQFYFVCPKETLDTTEAYDFIDPEPAMRFCEEQVLRVDPLRAPRASRPRRQSSSKGSRSSSSQS